jgi:hypothetical protein
MGWLAIALVVVVVILLAYIRRLKQEIRCYQETWVEIEELTDHNKEGDVVVHIKRT